MYAQNGAGLGHFRRCATVAAAIGDAAPRAHVVIASRSLEVANAVGVPDRCDVLKLPTFAVLGEDAHGERRVLLDQEPPRFAAARSALLATALDTLRPDAVLVDNEPRGLQGEMLAGLRRCRADGRAIRVLLGLRDIRGHASHVRAKWSADGTAEALETLYDGVLIYGDPAIYDAVAAYGLGDDIAVDTEYVGYVFASPGAGAASRVRCTLAIDDRAPLVAVTAGSGADGHSLLARYLRDAVPRLPPEVVSVVVAGPLMASAEYDRLASIADVESVRLLRSFDAVALTHAADAVVCRGGYNSVCETVHAGHTPLIVPRATASGEQEARAEAFCRLGLVTVLDPVAIDGGALADGVVRQLEHGRRHSDSPLDPTASAARAAARVLG